MLLAGASACMFFDFFFDYVVNLRIINTKTVVGTSFLLLVPSF